MDDCKNLKIEEVVSRLLSELKLTNYGTVGVEFVIHDGQIRTIEYSRKEKILPNCSNRKNGGIPINTEASIEIPSQ